MSEYFWMDVYTRFQKMDKTRKHLLRRTAHTNDLLENPVFYELYSLENKEKQQRSQILRLVFCLPYIFHQEGGQNLGAVFARSDKNKPVISEKRMIQLYRTNQNDKAMEYLRRLLVQAQEDINGEKYVRVDWKKMGKELMFWNEDMRREILEDYFLALKKANN